MRLSEFLEMLTLETEVVIADADRGGQTIYEGNAGAVPQRVMNGKDVVLGTGCIDCCRIRIATKMHEEESEDT